ncbi:MAG TPA: 4-alpha-glucanotransferase [Gammaproteobacteria bacterium]|nr:4-alpha-glucanotransferase [Gammaproteobacteria bacterium]
MSSALQERGAGVLLHPTSLPGVGWQGCLGDDAHRFIDFLAQCRFKYWQMLPLNPVGGALSPYHSYSAFAGSALLICLERLKHLGIDLGDCRLITSAEKHKTALRRAHKLFHQQGDSILQGELQQFIDAHRYWLHGYALFCALKAHFNQAPWYEWPAAYRQREDDALNQMRQQLAEEIGFYYFEQWIFYRQWADVRNHAHACNIQLIGDLPIFVAHDSADVWEHQMLFKIDSSGHASVVTGVPPDYFSESGQRWGNPHYRWDVMAADDYNWWKQRVGRMLELSDLTRIDHFLGFSSSWEIPAHEMTAIHGYWVNGPGDVFFESLQKSFSPLPLIAEDLGIVTDDVVRLRERFELPGMKILQFAFDSDSSNPYLPHNHQPNGVIYTGTHDNNTTMGWYNGLPDRVRQRVHTYFGESPEPMPWLLIRGAFASVCHLAIVPMQDLLSLGAEHRMNVPGTTEGNWSWRFKWEDIDPGVAAKVAAMLTLYGRA